MKRVRAGKTILLGLWSDKLKGKLRRAFANSFIFPMGAVPKKAVDPSAPVEYRPTDDHTRTGLNAATDLTFLKHSLDTYNEIAWFLKQDSISGRMRSRGDERIPSASRQALDAKSTLDGLSAGFAAVGTYSNQHAACVPKFHAWKRWTSLAESGTPE